MGGGAAWEKHSPALCKWKTVTGAMQRALAGADRGSGSQQGTTAVCAKVMPRQNPHGLEDTAGDQTRRPG
jgi:hypothetical protein